MLQARALSIQAGRRALLPDLDWSIKAGECWALLGRNGSGKTLLLHTMAGLRPAAQGSVWLHGRALTQWPGIERARALALLTQEEPLEFWGTVADHVALGCLAQSPRASAPTVASALRCMHLSALAERPWRVLSGGERQRTRIAQCLAQQTAVLLFDEPLNHLDPAFQGLTLGLARQMANEGRAVVLSVHDVAAARRYCTHALLLYDSKHFKLGPVAEVLDEASLQSLYPLDPPESHDPPPATRHPEPPAGPSS